MTLPPDGSDERDELPDSGLGDDFDFDAEFAKAFGGEVADGGTAPSTATRPRAIVAVVLTPVASAPALAGLLAMAGVDAQVVPTSRGALAATVIERATEDDPAHALAELLDDAPEVAAGIAATCSRTSRHGAVLLVSRLGEGDEGLVGTIAASQWRAGARTDEKVAAGLVLAQSDDVVEQLLLGQVAPEDAPGVVAPGKLPPWQARRLFRKTQRGPRP